MDPFHVIRLIAEALGDVRRRLPQDTLGRRGHASDPLYAARRLLTGVHLLTEKQWTRLHAVFAGDDHVQVQATWSIYEKAIAAYRDTDRVRGKAPMAALVDALATGVPAALVEFRRLGRTLQRRAADVLAHFDRPGTSNEPTEAINGRMAHLRGYALGFRNLTNHIAPKPARDRRLQERTTPSIAMSRATTYFLRLMNITTATITTRTPNAT